MAINLSDSILIGQQKPVDDRYFNQLVPYTSVAEANSLIPVAKRHIGLFVNINSALYWYNGGISDVNLEPFANAFPAPTLQSVTEAGATTNQNLTFSGDLFFSNLTTSPTSTTGKDIVLVDQVTNKLFKVDKSAFVQQAGGSLYSIQFQNGDGLIDGDDFFRADPAQRRFKVGFDISGGNFLTNLTSIEQGTTFNPMLQFVGTRETSSDLYLRNQNSVVGTHTRSPFIVLEAINTYNGTGTILVLDSRGIYAYNNAPLSLFHQNRTPFQITPQNTWGIHGVAIHDTEYQYSSGNETQRSALYIQTVTPHDGAMTTPIVAQKWRLATGSTANIWEIQKDSLGETIPSDYYSNPSAYMLTIMNNQGVIKYYGTKTLDANSLITKQYVDDAISSFSTTFLGLTDTPNSYGSSNGYAVRVNSVGTGLEFVEFPTSLPIGGSEGDVLRKNSNVDGDADWYKLIDDTTTSSTTVWSSEKVSTEIGEVSSDLSTHVSDINNPHGTTLAQVLESSDDAGSKPINNISILTADTIDNNYLNVLNELTINVPATADNHAMRKGEHDADIAYLQTQIDNKQNALGFTPENVANKNANNGYAGLDSGGKIPSSLLPSTVMELQGSWNASTNTPTLADGIGSIGDVYECTVAGTVTFGTGNTDTFRVGDWAVYGADGKWYKSRNSNEVTSVNGQTGTVVLNTSHISESGNLYFTTARVLATVLAGFSAVTGNIIATDTVLEAFGKVQNFINNIAATVRSVTLSGYTLGSNAALSAADTILEAFGKLQAQINAKQNALTFDSTPTASSTNPVTSGGVKTALDTKQDATNKATAAEINTGTDAGKHIVPDQLNASRYLTQKLAKVTPTIGGTGTAYTATFSPALSAWTDIGLFIFVPNVTNTGAAKITPAGLSERSLTKAGATALVAGDLVANQAYLAYNDGTRVQIISQAFPYSVDNRQVTDSDIITAITSASYNASSDYYSAITPAGGKVMKAGQLYFFGKYRFEAVADNYVRRSGGDGSDTYVAVPETANYTATAPGFYELPVLTLASRTFQMPSPIDHIGCTVIIQNSNTSGTYSWSFAATNRPKTAAGVDVSLANTTNYIFKSNGTNWYLV